MEVEIGMDMEVEVEMLVDRKLKNMVVVLVYLINVKNQCRGAIVFYRTIKKHSRGAGVLLTYKKNGRGANVFNEC